MLLSVAHGEENDIELSSFSFLLNYEVH